MSGEPFDVDIAADKRFFLVLIFGLAAAEMVALLGMLIWID